MGEGPRAKQGPGGQAWLGSLGPAPPGRLPKAAPRHRALTSCAERGTSPGTGQPPPRPLLHVTGSGLPAPLKPHLPSLTADGWADVRPPNQPGDGAEEAGRAIFPPDSRSQRQDPEPPPVDAPETPVGERKRAGGGEGGRKGGRGRGKTWKTSEAWVPRILRNQTKRKYDKPATRSEGRRDPVVTVAPERLPGRGPETGSRHLRERQSPRDNCAPHRTRAKRQRVLGTPDTPPRGPTPDPPTCLWETWAALLRPQPTAEGANW